MAGTAVEQAVGIGKPVLQLPGHGPQFTAQFAEAQRRLLGPTVFCAKGDPGNANQITNTISLLLELLQRSKNDLKFRMECLEQARVRIGPSGGAKNIARAINFLI